MPPLLARTSTRADGVQHRWHAQEDDGKVKLKTMASTWVPWRSRGAVAKVRSGLLCAMIRILTDMGVSHERPPTRLLMAKLQQSDAAYRGSGGSQPVPVAMGPSMV